jgi:DNA-binding NarL/FixJ family response regulator
VTVARLLLVDDHRAFAGALAHRLDAEPDLEVVGVAASVETAEVLAGSLSPDLAVVDVELGPDDGLDLVRRLSRLDAGPAVVVVTCHADAGTATDAVRAGAAAFVPKDAPVDQLLSAIRAALAGERWVPGNLLGGVLRLLQDGPGARAKENPVARLTPREREVLQLLVAGLDRAAIGDRLFLSPNTVRTHVQNVLRKLEVHSSIEAVGLALRHGVRAPASDV